MLEMLRDQDRWLQRQPQSAADEAAAPSGMTNVYYASVSSRPSVLSTPHTPQEERNSHSW